MALKDKKKGIGFKFAWNGLKETIRLERNFRIHLVFTCIVLIVSLVLSLKQWEWVAIIFAIALVLIAELMNTVIERIIDYVKPDIHPEAKIIKDVGAAIVLLAAILSIAIGLFVFVPYILNFIF